MGGSLGGKQGQPGEQEPGFCHSSSVGKGETHDLTPLPILFPFFLACIPLGSPSPGKVSRLSEEVSGGPPHRCQP